MSRDEIAKNDFNISPSPYIRPAAGEDYRPIAEIVEELEALEEEAVQTNLTLKSVLRALQI